MAYTSAGCSMVGLPILSPAIMSAKAVLCKPISMVQVRVFLLFNLKPFPKAKPTAMETIFRITTHGASVSTTLQLKLEPPCCEPAKNLIPKIKANNMGKTQFRYLLMMYPALLNIFLKYKPKIAGNSVIEKISTKVRQKESCTDCSGRPRLRLNSKIRMGMLNTDIIAFKTVRLIPRATFALIK